jgi:hypothetical protein
MQTLKKPLFPLGRLFSTPGALEALGDANANADPLDYLMRHHTGDWGDLCADDKAQNDAAVKDGGRIFSAYILTGTKVKIWIITEADRSCTTILLPDEY